MNTNSMGDGCTWFLLIVVIDSLPQWTAIVKRFAHHQEDLRVGAMESARIFLKKQTTSGWYGRMKGKEINRIRERGFKKTKAAGITPEYSRCHSDPRRNPY